MIGRKPTFGVALAAALLLTACSDGTGPGGEPFDPARAEADVAVLTTLMGNQQLASFSAMSAYFDLSGAPSGMISSARAMLSSGSVTPETARGMALAAAEGLALRTTAGSTPSLEVLPPSVFGTTFVFDAETQTYVESDRTGAPANGVRFIVYAVDPISGQPIVGSEVGHADLIDTSVGSQSSAGLRLLLVSGTTTHLDYSFFAAPTQNGADLGVNGYVTDGTTRLNFDVDVAVSLGEEELAIDVDFAFTVPTRQFSVSGSLDGSAGESGSLGQVTLRIVSGGSNVRFEISEDASTINATVYVNNKIFATVTGDPESPQVLGAGGAELTAQEAQALGELLSLAGHIFEFFGSLLDPIDDLTGGAVVP